MCSSDASAPAVVREGNDGFWKMYRQDPRERVTYLRRSGHSGNSGRVRGRRCSDGVRACTVVGAVVIVKTSVVEEKRSAAYNIIGSKYNNII